MKFSIAINCSIRNSEQTLKLSCVVIKIKFNDIPKFVRVFCYCMRTLLLGPTYGYIIIFMQKFAQ